MLENKTDDVLYLKKSFHVVMAGVLLGVTACRRTPSPGENDQVESLGEISIDSILYDTTKTTLAGKMSRDSTMPEIEKITVKVDTSGILVNEKHLENASLEDTLQAIWQVQWEQYEKIPPVSVRFSDEILMGVRGNIHDQLKTARAALRDTLSEHTFQLRYKSLKYKQQAVLKKKYPALFKNGENGK